MNFSLKKRAPMSQLCALERPEHSDLRWQRAGQGPSPALYQLGLQERNQGFLENMWSRHGPGDAHSKCHYPITSGSKKPPIAAWDLFTDPEPTAHLQMGHGRSKGGGAMDWKKQMLKVQNDSKTKMYWLSQKRYLSPSITGKWGIVKIYSIFSVPAVLTVT